MNLSKHLRRAIKFIIKLIIIIILSIEISIVSEKQWNQDIDVKIITARFFIDKVYDFSGKYLSEFAGIKLVNSRLAWSNVG